MPPKKSQLEKKPSEEKKILPVSTSSKNQEIPIKKGISPVSSELIDLRSKPSSHSASQKSSTPFFWLNAPKNSQWRQNFLRRMQKLDRPENFTPHDEIAPLMPDSAATDIPCSKSSTSDIPTFILKLVSSNHTWAHRSWHAFASVSVGWTNSPWMRAFVLFFVFCCLLIIPVKAANFSNQPFLNLAPAADMISSLSSRSILADILGQSTTRRYLIVFQNDSLARATGGSMDSLALLDLDKSQISHFEILNQSPSSIGQNLKDNFASPLPISAISPRWDLTGSAWWPDFPTSAREIAWFYENSGGATVDGVIAINNSYLTSLTANLGLSLDSISSSSSSSSGSPSAPELLSEIFSFFKNDPSEISKNLSDSLSKAISSQEVQVYFTDSTAESFAVASGWGGELKENSSDYLALINDNIFSNQSVVIQNASLETATQDDSSLVNTLNITFSSDSPNQWTYLRIYVPKNSILLSENGFTPFDYSSIAKFPGTLLPKASIARVETNSYFSANNTRVYQENGKTVFSNWIKTSSTGTQTLAISYLLPFGSSKPYDFYWQKQSGVPDFELETSRK